MDGPKFESLTTTIGVPLYIMHIPRVNSVAVGVLVRAGGRDESEPREFGIAHAVEHMVFQGTASFPTSKDAAAYLEEVGGTGGMAFTTYEGTLFGARAPAEHAERAVRLISELTLHAVIPEEKIQTEMANIIEEIKMGDDDPQMFLGRTAHEFIYNGHPLGHPLAGTKESVGAFTRDQLVVFRDRFYHAGNFVFVAVGNITTRDARHLFEQYFSGTVARASNIRDTVPVSRQTDRLVVKPRDIQQVNIGLIADIPGVAQRTNYGLELFSAMVDGGMSFPLFQEVRDKRGLCYAISAGETRYADVGDFFVYIGTSAERWQEAVEISKQVLKQSASDEVLLAKAKDLLTGRLKLHFEHTGGILELAAFDILTEGKPLNLDERLRRIESVTIDQVQTEATSYVAPDSLNTVLVAPANLAVPREKNHTAITDH